jgi:hypothetical protein
MRTMGDLLVYLLLLSPVSLPVPRWAPAPLWEATRRVAFRLELVGPGERWIDDWHSELAYLRRHWRALKTAPPLADCDRFPPRAVCLAQRAFVGERIRYLESRRQIRVREYEVLGARLQEARRVYEVWGLLADAQGSASSWTSRRRALLALRELLGGEDYEGGHWSSEL